MAPIMPESWEAFHKMKLIFRPSPEDFIEHLKKEKKRMKAEAEKEKKDKAKAQRVKSLGGLSRAGRSVLPHPFVR